MALTRIQLRPGFDSISTQTSNKGGWFDGNLVRWMMGYLEKLGGWIRLLASDVSREHIRHMHAWLDLANNKTMLLGTDRGPEILVNTQLVPLNVIRYIESESGLLSFSTTAGFSDVVVHLYSATPVAPPTGASIFFLIRVSLGHIILPAYTEVTVVGSATPDFTISMAVNAITTEGTFGVPLIRIIISAGVEGRITFEAHGQIVGSSFPIDQTTVFVFNFGIVFTLPGGSEVVVTNVIDANNFNFDATLWVTSYPNVPFSSIPVGLGDISLFEGTNMLAGTSGQVFAAVIPSAPVTTFQTSWFTDNFGEFGLAVFTGSPLLVYSPPFNPDFPFIAAQGDFASATAPQTNNGMAVAMPQAQVFVFGTEPVLGSGVIDPLLLRFSEAGDFSVWSATVSNQAGSFRLSRGSRIVGLIQAPQATLIWTDVGLWMANYIGPPLIWSFTEMGHGCDLIGPHAVGVYGRTTFWMSRQGIWQFGEGGVRPLPCPLWDYVFRDLDTDNQWKCFVSINSLKGEVTFNFPSLEDKEPDPVNLLAWSEDFSVVGAWSQSSVFMGVTVPPGTTMLELTDASTHGVSQVHTKNNAVIQYTFSVYCKNTSTRRILLAVATPNGGAVQVTFNPVTGLTTRTFVSGDMTLDNHGAQTDGFATGLAGNGWLRYFVTFTTDDTSAFVVNALMETAAGTYYYVGNGVSLIEIFGAQLNLGALVAYEATEIEQSNECTRYVKYNVVEGLWDPGAWPIRAGVPSERTAWIDENVFGNPIGADQDFRLQQHELGYDDDTEPMRGVFAESGYADASDGELIPAMSRCLPDMKWFGQNGAVNYSIKTVNEPGGDADDEVGNTVVVHGPFPVTPTTRAFNMHIRARQMALRIDWLGLRGFSARVGAVRINIKRAGKGA